METNENLTPDSQESAKHINYSLSSDAVETLANADKEEAPQYSEEELKKYRTKKHFHISEPVKILFLKAWFAGAVCYFILWGLGMYINSLDMLLVLGIVLGMVTDLLTNNVIRFIETLPQENEKWLLVTHRGVVGFGLNMLLSTIIVAIVVMIYNGINLLAVAISGDPKLVFLGVEPILFGILCMGLDMLMIGIKRLIQSIFRDAKSNTGDIPSGEA